MRKKRYFIKTKQIGYPGFGIIIQPAVVRIMLVFFDVLIGRK